METTDTIQEGVREIIADTLAVEPEEVVPSARLFRDLGAESIDLIDLSFRCEKRFGVRVAFEEFSRAAEAAMDANGSLTPEAISTLQGRFPFFDLTSLSRSPAGARLADFLTVGAVTHFVQAAVTGAALGKQTL